MALDTLAAIISCMEFSALAFTCGLFTLGCTFPIAKTIRSANF